MVGLFSLLIGLTNLKLRMDWTYLFYPDDDIVVAGLLHREKFPLPGDVAVLVDQGTEVERRVLVDRIAQRMLEEPELFHHVLHRLDISPLASKALYYLDEEHLQQTLRSLESLNFTESPAGAFQTESGKKVLLRLLEDLSLALETRGRAAHVPLWETLISQEEATPMNYIGRLLSGEKYIYPTLGQGKIQVVAAKAGSYGQEFSNPSPMIIRLREILTELRPTFGNLRVRMTGLPVLLHDERETVSGDGTRSSIVSLILVVLVFSIGFGELKRPLLATVALCCGLSWTIGFTTLAIGHLNFISVTLATMLMGVGIDFGIHFIFRYDEEMSKGLRPESAISKTLEGTGIDTLVGASATASAFLALTQAHFRGISDFGIIAAGGTLLCYLSTITVLPALLSLFPGQPRGLAGSSREVAWLEGRLLSKARWVVLLWSMVIVSACVLATKVGFSYNLLEVQAQEVSTVRTELEMIRERNTVLSAESVSRGESQARTLLEKFSNLPSVANVSSVLPLLPETSPREQELITKIVQRISKVDLPPRISLETAEDLSSLNQKVENFRLRTKSELDPAVEHAASKLRRDIERMDPGPIQDGLVDFQDDMRNDLRIILDFLKKQKAEGPKLGDLPPELLLRYVSRDGYFRQNIQPVKNIWERENLEEFLVEIKSVDPAVMGHPVIQEAILSAFHRTLDRTPWFTLLGVFLVFTLYLRSVKAVVLSLLPASLAVLMIFATMGALGMSFNVVNFVGLPISVGLGAVYGVHSLHRMRELGGENVLTTSTGPALLLSGVTDIVGFASLMTAAHQGISSLGLVISVGVGVSFVASLILLPTLKRVFRERRGPSPKETI